MSENNQVKIRRVVIGVAGLPSSGKDTFAHVLTQKGFTHISSSDLIREEMRGLGLTLERPAVRDFVSARRKERGADYLVRQIAKKIKGNTVITGLRSTKEIATLRDLYGGDFMLIALDAPLTVRYERAKKRNRTGDNISIEQFKEQEDIERNNSPETQEIDNVVAMADKVITNTGSKPDFEKKILEALEL